MLLQMPHGDEKKDSDRRRETFSKRKELMRKKLDRNLKKRMIKTNAMGCHAVAYVSQVWATRKEDIKILEALEM